MADYRRDRLEMDRRGFLRWMAGGVAAATAGLSGCGGGGGSGSGGTVPIGSISEEDRAASLDAIVAFLNTIANQPLDDQIDAALNFISPRPEFVRTGADTDGVWGIYPDGVPLMILCNRLNDPVRPAGQGPMGGTRAPTEVPTPAGVRLIQALGNAFIDELPLIDPLFAGNGYTTFGDPGSVESLRTVAGDGTFYMSTHAGGCSMPVFSPDGNFVRDSAGGIAVRREFGVWTSTVASQATVAPYMDDLLAQRLGIGMALHNEQPDGTPIYERHYWFTAAWVQNYMSFGANSLVWFSACRSNSTVSANFVQACIAKGAGLFVGWNRTVTSEECIDVGTFVIDRLIGANTTNPQETPPQRPFDYPQVWQDLAQRTLPAGLVYTVGSDFGLLAPTIAYVLINEFDDEAALYGTFGSPAASERAVLIGGIEATVKSWTNGQIVCQLPRTGTGSAGNVEVWVRGHKSNVRRITEWQIPMNSRWFIGDSGVLKVFGPFNLRFRADVGEYREAPGVDPIKPVRWAIATRDSMAQLTATGQIIDGECTTTLTGTANFPSPLDPNMPHLLAARMKIDTATNTGAIGLALGAQTIPFILTVVCPGSTLSNPIMVSTGLMDGVQDFFTPDPNRGSIPLPALNIAFGTNYTIPARPYNDPIILFELKQDQDVIPFAPPDPNAAVRPPQK